VTFVNENYENLVDMMKAEFTPQEVCTFIHSCTADDETSMRSNGKNDGWSSVIVQDEPTLSEHESVVSSKECSLCELVIFNVEKNLRSNATEAEVESILLQFCPHIGNKVLKDECINFTKNHIRDIVALLQRAIVPKKICEQLHLCSVHTPAPVAKVSDECLACETILGSVHGVINDPFLDHKAVLTENKICEYLPTKYGPMCKQIVGITTMEVLSISLGIPPWYVCSKFNRCPYLTEGAEGLLGPLSGCTAGPSYWCTSLPVASKCGAVKYCASILLAGVMNMSDKQNAK